MATKKKHRTRRAGRGSTTRRKARRRSGSYGTVVIGKRTKRRLARSKKRVFRLKNPWVKKKGRIVGYKVSKAIAKQINAINATFGRGKKKRSGGKKKKRAGGRKRSSYQKKKHRRPKKRIFSGVKRKKAKKKYYRWPPRGRRVTSRWARGARVKRPVFARGRRRRHRPYKGRKVMVPLYRGYKMSPWRKRKLIRGGYLSRAGMVNPYGSRRRRRKNPGDVVDRVKSFFTSTTTWAGAGHILLGMSGAVIGPALAEAGSKGKIANQGELGIFMSGVSSALQFAAALYAESALSKGGEAPAYARNLARNVGLGGLAVTILRGLFHYAPQVAEYLKLSPVRQPVYALGRPTPAPAAAPGKAQGDWLALQGMGYGMGRGLDPNEALIAGESFARSVSQFEGMGDFMELKGMGASPFAVPMRDLRGMGNWIELANGSELAQTTFDPAMETF